MYDVPRPGRSESAQRRRRWASDALFAVVSGFGIIIALIAVASAGARTVTHHVEFIAGGTAGIAAISDNIDGVLTMTNGNSLPWRTEFAVRGALVNRYALIVQNMNFTPITTTVTCEIKVDGRTVRKREASGPGSMADCNYPN